MKKNIIFSILFLIIHIQVYSTDTLTYNNEIYKEGIHTVLLSLQGNMLSMPIIELNSQEKLQLEFDDFSETVGSYYYTFVHCDSRWKSSDLQAMDYLNGFVENQIQTFKYSFNTLQPYINFQLTIPNNDVSFKLSGNYCLIVYEDADINNVVLTKRFSVVDYKMTIDASIKQATIIEKRKSHQEIDFTLNSLLKISDPYSEIMPVILQNGRWDIANMGLKPSFVKDNEYIYDFEDENIFAGSSEFFYVDAKSFRYQSERIKNIEYIKPLYHIYLYDNDIRRFKVYITWDDINGKYFVKNSDATESSVEADYAYFYFSLKSERPFLESDVFIAGSFSDWQLNDKYKMTYNSEKQIYETKLLLKQGFINYQYLVLEKGKNVITPGLIEGNHYETENDYTFLIYVKAFGSRYEQLVGFKTFNTKSIGFNKY